MIDARPVEMLTCFFQEGFGRGCVLHFAGFYCNVYLDLLIGLRKRGCSSSDKAIFPVMIYLEDATINFSELTIAERFNHVDLLPIDVIIRCEDIGVVPVEIVVVRVR